MTPRAFVLQHSQTFAACNDFVGRAPWPAADPLVGPLRPTFWLPLCCYVGQTIVFCGLPTEFKTL
jgi:hypothetical protein